MPAMEAVMERGESLMLDMVLSELGELGERLVSAIE